MDKEFNEWMLGQNENNLEALYEEYVYLMEECNEDALNYDEWINTHFQNEVY